MLYPTLVAAVADLDPLLVKTLIGFTVTERYEGFQVELSFALWGPRLEEMGGESTNTVEQCPNSLVELSPEVDVRHEIERLEEAADLGTLRAFQIPAGWPGNDSSAPKWVVKCHAGSTAEHLQWVKTIQ